MRNQWCFKNLDRFLALEIYLVTAGNVYTHLQDVCTCVCVAVLRSIPVRVPFHRFSSMLFFPLLVTKKVAVQLTEFFSQLSCC